MELPLRETERLVAVATRSFHSAALTSHGRLVLWGDNAFGQLGTEVRAPTGRQPWHPSPH